MNIVTNRLRNALVTVPKYNLLPNSDYTCKRKLNPILSIKLNSEKKGPLGTLRVKLYENITPKTAENYKRLLLGKGQFNGRPLSLSGVRFHEVIRNAYASTGRLADGNMSIYGPKFKDESFAVLHTKAGLLSSVSQGNTNSSEFIITLGPCPYLDYKNVVFGQVIQNCRLVNYLDHIGSKDGYMKDVITFGEAVEQEQHDHHPHTRWAGGYEYHQGDYGIVPFPHDVPIVHQQQKPY